MGSNAQAPSLIETREVMAADGQALAAHGLLPRDKLKELKGPTSHTSTAFDVLALATLFRAHWDAIAGKTALQMSEVEQAEAQADQLLSAVGERAVSDAEVGAATLNRKRAFALFGRAYEEMRRGISVLRWHEGDLDELIPSLYAGRGPIRSRAPGGGDNPESAPPVPSPGNGTPAQGRLPVGHPDSSPFIS